MLGKRKTRGRQKIEMKKITNENNLQVTFSKRRNGLFKKVSELCTLCGVDIALVVFSPSGKVFSFGHPNVETVINRYVTQVPPQNDGTMQFIVAHRNANVRELNAQLTQVKNQLEADKKYNEHLNCVHREALAQFWWAFTVEDMNKAQLEALQLVLKKLKQDVAHHTDKPITKGNYCIVPHFLSNDECCSLDVSLHYPLPPPLTQMFPPTGFFQNPMMQAYFNDEIMYHRGYNSTRGYGF